MAAEKKKKPRAVIRQQGRGVEPKYKHPLARSHKRGTSWPNKTIAIVVQYAAIHTINKAATHFIGIPRETIIGWVVRQAKPDAELKACERIRLAEIKRLGEKIIHRQMKTILKKIKKVKAGEGSLKDQAATMKSLAHTLSLLGATSQKLEVSDITEEVRASRREADEALAQWEKEHGLS